MKKELQSKDLRLGNWVCYDMSVDDLQYIQLKIGDLANFAIELSELYPIRLTEEWLLKFGFKPFYDFSKWSIELCDINVLCIDKSVDEDYYSCISVYDTLDDYPVHLMSVAIDYVHQLQNLYFALTGVELELKNGIKPEYCN